MKELLEELEAAVQPQALEKRQSLEVRSCSLKEERFLGDKLRLSQILLNLLSNAVKYTPKGGHIELSILELPETSGEYAHLCFQVRDDGVGISPEYLTHIFDPFTRENNTTASGILGIGLGLTITRNLVEQMGGTIRAESTPGQGSTFRVELELRYAAQPVQTEAPAPRPGAKGLDGRRVLTAEDNDINAEILEALLSCEGVACERTFNGQEALERFRQSRPGYYDAVLMDIQMPVMNGYDCARAIRALDRPDAKTIPIVAMTANAFAEDVHSSMDAGMNAHLAKPVDMEKLKDVLENLIHREG